MSVSPKNCDPSVLTSSLAPTISQRIVYRVRQAKILTPTEAIKLLSFLRYIFSESLAYTLLLLKPFIKRYTRAVRHNGIAQYMLLGVV
jgi:hypothetical protein